MILNITLQKIFQLNISFEGLFMIEGLYNCLYVNFELL